MAANRAKCQQTKSFQTATKRGASAREESCVQEFANKHYPKLGRQDPRNSKRKTLISH